MSIYDNLKLVSYAAAADAFDKSKNIFCSFLPMIEVLLVLPEEKMSIQFLALQNLVNDAYGINIPKATLKYLLEMLEQQGKVRFLNGKTIVPTKQKIAEEVSLHGVNKDKIEDLFASFQEYLTERGEAVAVSEIRTEICKWIYLHSNEIAEFISAGSVSNDLSDKLQDDNWQYSSQLLLFLLESRAAKTEPYNAFLRLFDGAVQASLLNFLPKEIEEITKPNATAENVVLDTNVVLRLLELQAELDNETAISTWNILNDGGTKFFVLEQTVAEASQSIKSFLDETAPYTQRVGRYLPKVQIHTTGFLAAQKQGISRTTFFEYSKESKIREVLKEKFLTEIVDEFDDPSISEETQKSLISAKNSDRYGFSQAKHDLLLISFCRKKRPRRLESVQSASWWVLTNDKKLTFWNQKNSGIIQECITESQISNLLWLQARKSNSDGLTNTIMALAAKTATSVSEIAAFAESVEVYCSRNEAHPDVLDRVSLVFAASAITSDDIRAVNADVDEFGAIIETKVSEIQYQQTLTASELARSKDNNEGLSQELKVLKENFERKQLENKKKTLEREIESQEKIIANAQAAINEIFDIKDVCKQKHAPIGRKIVLIGLIVLVGVLAVLYHYLYPTVITWLKLQTEHPGVGWNLISIGLFGGAAAFVYYVLITLIFGTPLNGAEAFNRIRELWLLKIRSKYVLKKHYNSHYADGDLDKMLEQESNMLAEGKEKVITLKKELSAFDEQL